MGIKTNLSKNIKKHASPFRLAILGGLGIMSLGIVISVLAAIATQNRTRHLKLFAGANTGESFILSKALATVVKQQHPKIVIDVVETGGTAESLAGLEQGKADLAAAQADVPAGQQARIVATLFPDSFQLVVPRNSPIRSFADLKGKRIALPQKGGQYRSFLTLASHFGLKEVNLIFIGDNQTEADNAYREGRADAAFYVRALGSVTIQNWIRSANSRLVPIDQVKALQIKYPAFEPSVIPRGVYLGSPTVPETDLSTIAVQRTLIADKDIDPELIRIITMVLNEQRQAIAQAIPEEYASLRSLVTYIDRPKVTGGTGIPIHEGAIAYYEREKPSFIQENADYVALILTIILLLFSWIVEAKNWFESQRKDAADIYIDVAVELMQDEVTGTPEENRAELDKIFMKAARDLVEERISQESFRTFNEAYKSSREVIERKMNAQREMLLGQSRVRQMEQEAERKETADQYILSLLEVAESPHLSTAEMMKRYDQIVIAASKDLIGEKISQESFRTFMEAYKALSQGKNLSPRP